MIGKAMAKPKQEPASGHREHRDRHRADEKRQMGTEMRENRLPQDRHRAEEQRQSETSVIGKRPATIKLVPNNACQSDTGGSAADNSRPVSRPSRGATRIYKSDASYAAPLQRVGAPSMIDPSPPAARTQPRGTAGSEAPGLAKPRQTKPAQSRRCVVDSRISADHRVDVEESSDDRGCIEQEAPHEDDEVDDGEYNSCDEEEIGEIEGDEEGGEEEYDDRPTDHVIDEMPLAWNPLPVALVAAGLKIHDQMNHIKPMVRRNEGVWFEWCVLKDLWKDPKKGGIGHRENGTHPNTQKSVFKQEGFVPLVQEMVQWIIEVTLYAPCDDGDDRFYNQGVGIVVECNHGCHRSDTVMRKVGEILNQVRAPNGVRMFNCNIFPMVWAYGDGGIREMVQEAELWVNDPWELALDMSRAPKCSLYGAVYCQHDRLASQACEALWKYKEDQLPVRLQALIDDRLPDNPGLHDCLCTIPAHEADVDNRSNVGQSGHPGQTGYTRSLPVYQNSLSESLDDVIYINDEMFCRTAARTGAQGDVPAYVSLEFDAHAWFHILEDYHIDELGRRNFFELAQCHYHASFECMDILMKLKNKSFHGEFRDDASRLPEDVRVNRWFHKSTSRARTRLTEWYWDYGKGGGKGNRRAKNSRKVPY